MNVLLVCYDLHLDNNYNSFYDTLESYDHCWAMDNHCLVRTNNSADEVRDKLLPYTGGQDNIMVCRFDNDWSGVNNEAESWLKERKHQKA